MTYSHKSPMHKLLASAGAVSIVAASFAAVPASFAAENPPAAAAENNGPCRHVAATATSYQGLPGEYQLAYSNGNLYTTFANGRPPILTGGIGVWNESAAGPSLTQVLQPSTVDFTPRGANAPTGKQVAAPYGIAVDEANGTIWVTQTRINAVSVYDINTKQLVWSSYNEANPSEGAVKHPREVKVDAASGRAFVSGSGGVTVFDLKTHEVIKKIAFTNNGEEDIAMNMELDASGGKLYVPAMGAGTLNVINTGTLENEKTITLHKDVDSAALRPSDVTIDKSLQEIYVSSQGEMDRQSGVSKGNAGVTVYDLNTGEYKKSIQFGKQTLSITADEKNDLVYATDFATGKVGVIDARTGTVSAEVNAGKNGANDVLVTPEGTAYAVTRDAYAEGIKTDYTIDPKTGQYRESTTEPKGQDGAETPINANSLVKINTTVTEKPAAKPDQGEQVTAAADDGATASVQKVVQEKGKLTITGKAFKDKEGGPSKIAVKFDGGATPVEGKGHVFVDADAEGNFSTTISVPEQWTTGSTHSITLLTGSGNRKDPIRSLTLDVNVEAAGGNHDKDTCAPAETAQVTPTKSTNEVTYPKGTPTTPTKQADPKIQVSKTELDAAADNNELQVNGSGFYGHITSKGARVGVYEADASGKPTGESIVDEKLINASDINDGRFSVTLNIPGSKLDASKKYVAVAATVSAEAGMHAETPLTVKPADQKPDVKPIPNTPLYKDVNQDTAFYAEIQWLGSQNITTGYPDGTFRPGQNVERAAMAAYFYRMAGSPEVTLPKESPFKDVDPSFPFYKEIVWMHQRGITTGYWDGTFRPHDPVNRDAMAAFFYRYAGAPGYTAPVNSPFNDVQNGDAFYQEITWLKQQGITKGWSDGTYRPGEPIHRDAMAAFIHRYSAIVKK